MVRRHGPFLRQQPVRWRGQRRADNVHCPLRLPRHLRHQFTQRPPSPRRPRSTSPAAQASAVASSHRRCTSCTTGASFAVHWTTHVPPHGCGRQCRSRRAPACALRHALVSREVRTRPPGRAAESAANFQQAPCNKRQAGRTTPYYGWMLWEHAPILQRTADAPRASLPPCQRLRRHGYLLD